MKLYGAKNHTFGLPVRYFISDDRRIVLCDLNICYDFFDHFIHNIFLHSLNGIIRRTTARHFN